MSPGLRTRCTVLFADLRGSTSLYERLGNAAAAGLVTQIVQALATGATGFQGRVVKTLGDGLIALFASAQSGVEAALNMQALIAGTAGIGLKLDHAGDQEILVTHQVLEQVDEPTRRMFRSLDTLSLRGRAQWNECAVRLRGTRHVAQKLMHSSWPRTHRAGKVTRARRNGHCRLRACATCTNTARTLKPAAN
jgi:class 3 adenylate cyclase